MPEQVRLLGYSDAFCSALSDLVTEAVQRDVPVRDVPRAFEGHEGEEALYQFAGRREWVLQAVDCLIAKGRIEYDGKKVVPAVPRIGNDLGNDHNGSTNGNGTFPEHSRNESFPSPIGERLPGTTLEAVA